MAVFDNYKPNSESQRVQNELELDLASEILQRQVHIRANLPGKLAELALAGREKEAISALISWGTGKKPLTELWEEVTKAIEKL